ncbi:hypothetical protein IFM89_019339 [Coptis chinensis]|uniref:Agenet domain-containing protein n=1 Tax=Coptis chinensis TaxID=261450 RepID=A0A835I3K3_9MAGN|nr:hypothetical protein IFM89_019339 [Coptis chinensis]
MHNLKEFVNGEEIEVSSNEIGFEESWFSATLIRPSNKKNSTKFLIEYKTLLKSEESGQPLTEYVDFDQLRPVPPVGTQTFNLNDDVDAYHNDGWWRGSIIKVFDEGLKFLVFFRPTKEKLKFGVSDLRKHLEWVDGKWETAVLAQNEGSAQSPNTPTPVFSAFCSNESIFQTPNGVLDIAREMSMDNHSTPKGTGSPSPAALLSQENMNLSIPKSYSAVSRPFKRVRKGKATKVPTCIKTCHARESSTRSSTDAQYVLPFPTTKGKRSERHKRVRSKVLDVDMTFQSKGLENKPASKEKVLKRKIGRPVVLGHRHEKEMPKALDLGMAYTSKGLENKSACKEKVLTKNRGQPIGERHERGRPKALDLGMTCEVKVLENNFAIKEKVLKRKRERLIDSGDMREKGMRKALDLAMTCLSNGLSEESARKEKVLKKKRGHPRHSGLENDFSSKGIIDTLIECTPILSTNSAEENLPLSMFLQKSHSHVMKDNGGVMVDKQIVAVRERRNGRPKDSCKKPSVEGPEKESSSKEMTNKYQPRSTFLGKSGPHLLIENGGPKHEAANQEMTVVQIESTQLLNHTAEKDQPLPLCLEMPNSSIVIGHRGVGLDNQPISDKAIIMRDASMEVESLCLDGLTVSDDQYQYDIRRGHEISSNPVITENRLSSPIEQDEVPLPLQVENLPFVKNSFLWGILESYEVFKLMPQQPHFRPLKKYNYELREGYAIAHMSNFANVVERIYKASLDEPRSMFENMLKLLADLEEFGFIVQPIRARVEDLLKIKESFSQLDDRAKVAETEVMMKSLNFRR